MRPPAEYVGRTDSVVFRINNHKDALWTISNPPGRFNAERAGPTQYLSLHPLAPYAELIRCVERRLGRRLLADDPEITAARHQCWALRIESDDVFHLLPESAGVVGLSAADLVDDDQRRCREAGEKFGRQDAEFPKVWSYESAALPGTRNLVIFGARAMSAYHLDPVSVIDIPGSLVAAAALTPPEILPGVRHVGAEHPMTSEVSADWEQPTSFAVLR